MPEHSTPDHFTGRITTIYCLCDDFLKAWGHTDAPQAKITTAEVMTVAFVAVALVAVAKKPLFSDSEVLTLSFAQHWLGIDLGIDEERGFLRFIRNNHLPLFPRLVDQSQFNRRARSLCWLIHRMRQHLVRQMGVATSPCQLIDGASVQVRHWRRFGPGTLRLPEAVLGFYASKKLTYYGFRLLAVTTPDGIIA